MPAPVPEFLSLPMLFAVVQVSEIMSTLVTLNDFPLGEAFADEVSDMPDVFPPAASHVP